MDACESLYDQPATSFSLRLFLKQETLVPGGLIVELARSFLADLVLPPCRPTWLWTKRAKDEAKLNTGDFSERRWNAAVKKIVSGEFSVLTLFAAHPDLPKQQAWFSAHVNPVGSAGYSSPILGSIEFACDLSYLRQLTASAARIEALLRFGTAAWNGVQGEPAYGYGNLGFIPRQVPFNPHGPQHAGYQLPWDRDTPPARRPHAIPVAWIGADVDGNLDRSFCSAKGIKGAFWANFLSEAYVRQAGGAEAIGTGLPGIRIETLRDGGLLVVATESPLPNDSDENRQRFLAVHRVLQPAFMSRAETAANKRALLGYFYRENLPGLP
jgi:TseV toxin immunity protein TsiV